MKLKAENADNAVTESDEREKHLGEENKDVLAEGEADCTHQTHSAETHWLETAALKEGPLLQETPSTVEVLSQGMRRARGILGIPANSAQGWVKALEETRGIPGCCCEALGPLLRTSPRLNTRANGGMVMQVAGFHRAHGSSNPRPGGLKNTQGAWCA